MKKIVVVDDDVFIRDLVATALKDVYEVHTAATGTDGLACIHEVQPDLIMLDLELPDKHGLDVLTEVRAASATVDTPVVIFSNNESSEWKPKAMAAGATAYFVKVNLEMSELQREVDALLR